MTDAPTPLARFANEKEKPQKTGSQHRQILGNGQKNPHYVNGKTKLTDTGIPVVLNNDCLVKGTSIRCPGPWK